MTTPNQQPELTPFQAAAVKRKLLEADVIARAWADDNFRAKLEADPKATLASIGLGVPDNVSVTVAKATPNVLEIVLPPEQELDESELEAVAGGQPGALFGGSCQTAQNIKDKFEDQEAGSVVIGVISSAAFAVSAIFGNSWAFNG